MFLLAWGYPRAVRSCPALGYSRYMTQHPQGIDIKALKTGQIARRPDLPPRLTIHTTETPPGTGRSVARRLLWPYHNLIELKDREILNLIQWEKTAYSLRGKSWAGVETNHAGKRHIQISIVDYASRMGRLTKNDMKWLAQEVVYPILQANNIPNTWARAYGPNEGIILASTKSPIRLSPTEWENFSGVIYHQTVPGNTHWDAGGLNWKALMAYTGGMAPPSPVPVGSLPGAESPLSRGDSGVKVRELQELQNEWFNAGLDVDGDFGPATEKEVKESQAILAVRPDGVWGPKTVGAFETWVDDITNAVVQGIPPTPAEIGVPKAIKQLRQQGRKKIVAAEALDALEAMIASIYNTLGVVDSPAEAGMLDQLRTAKQKLEGMERDRVDALGAIS